MRPEDFNMLKITETLQGTCDDFDSTLEHFYPEMTKDDLTKDDYDEMDNEIFLCDICGWWYEVSERTENESGEDCCEDCSEE